ncbi:2-isopropylmalate synthase [Chelatococcus asaccharovorans]|uniref:2-isopropylmalate synthase n=1 Tax=Chelatococcus asaccharovorans TaxID=28210 RepID=UPI00224C6800|nr:2-isopropylmalate synthase [Chelatococcus asaccharovorans]CAH1665917.1 2-isopropylmalate synthase [Chelatococcus asaccharovorans]CAH1681720.1 2-isopropylmalate synthase [Chelatococcus asaccharovorans]
MLRDPSSKYARFNHTDLPDRTWPSRAITRAPRWLSTDLRDGNQALVDPMDMEKKRRFLDMLLKIGLKEIEVGFPSASQTEFDFVRHLVEGDLIPDDVSIQVLTQARRELIERTFESLRGAPRAIVHLYNAISPAWRRMVFGMDRAGVKDIAVKGVTLLREQADKYPETRWTFEYSPETFSTAEPDFALEVCEAVLDVLQPTPDHPVILNLPATVEAAGPHIYADQIERFCRQISRRDSVVISVHPHNDRGTGVAAAELAVQAGADRVEGCLFGNGERTGNVDLVTLALNLYTQGVDPGLDFSDIQSVVQTVQYCNQIPVHPRHPYAGELVFTAFSGSHQDAIKKGFEAQSARNDMLWDVPYLPIDPADLGCSYEAVIRVNSQSGKGGVAWVLEQDKGLKLPRAMQVDFSRVIQGHADATSRELTAADIWSIFQDTYRLAGHQRFALIDYRETGSAGSRDRMFVGRMSVGGEERSISGRGNGLLSGVLDALKAGCGIDMDILDYQEHAIGHGGDARAAAYAQCRTADGRVVFGVGIDTDVATASVRAVLSAANGLG